MEQTVSVKQNENETGFGFDRWITP